MKKNFLNSNTFLFCLVWPWIANLSCILLNEFSGVLVSFSAFISIAIDPIIVAMIIFFLKKEELK